MKRIGWHQTLANSVHDTASPIAYCRLPAVLSRRNVSRIVGFAVGFFCPLELVRVAGMVDARLLLLICCCLLRLLSLLLPLLLLLLLLFAVCCLLFAVCCLLSS